MFLPSYGPHTAAHTKKSALPFCRRSYWGSPPPDQWCPRLPGLWIPPPFFARSCRRNSAQHQRGGWKNTKWQFDKHQSAVLFPLRNNIPPAVIVMTFSCQNVCCCLGEGTPVTVGTDKRAQVGWCWVNINEATKLQSLTLQWFPTGDTYGVLMNLPGATWNIVQWLNWFGKKKKTTDYDLNFRKNT